MNILRKRTPQNAGVQPYIISISPDNYKKLNELKTNGNFPSVNDTLTELLKQVG